MDVIKGNIVMLDIKDYNKLRDISLAINEDELIGLDLQYDRVYCLNKNDTLISMQAKIDDLKRELYELKTVKHPNLKDIKKMSLFEFFKWKRVK